MAEENQIKRHPIYSDYGATKDGIVISFKNKRQKEMVTCKHQRGYTQFRVCLGKHNIWKQYLSHRFIWECFNGMIPPEMVIHHIDNDKKNNHIDNLIMVTDEENKRLAIEDGILQGAASPNYKRKLK